MTSGLAWTPGPIGPAELAPLSAVAAGRDHAPRFTVAGGRSRRSIGCAEYRPGRLQLKGSSTPTNSASGASSAPFVTANTSSVQKLDPQIATNFLDLQALGLVYQPLVTGG